MTHERCFLCGFWDGSKCTQAWRLSIHVEPLGGIVDFSTTPGMVPEELKDELHKYFDDIFTRFLLPLIEKIPTWSHIKDAQKEHPEREDCPARKIRDDIKPYLHVVKLP